jgi:hypothetical protein
MVIHAAFNDALAGFSSACATVNNSDFHWSALSVSCEMDFPRACGIDSDQCRAGLAGMDPGCRDDRLPAALNDRKRSTWAVVQLWYNRLFRRVAGGHYSGTAEQHNP